MFEPFVVVVIVVPALPAVSVGVAFRETRPTGSEEPIIILASQSMFGGGVVQVVVPSLPPVLVHFVTPGMFITVAGLPFNVTTGGLIDSLAVRERVTVSPA